jgi:organic hydroperoxide reductase OsmC/OhrA
VTGRKHDYRVVVRWTGDAGEGTTAYTAYRRDHVIEIAGKPDLAASSDPAFRGDPGRHNPEELLVASIASCHMLWYLHLCAVHGVVVREYRDEASGTLELAPDGGGRFVEVVLRPSVGISEGDLGVARRQHDAAQAKCFIANSVNFPVRHEATVTRVASS